MEGLYRGLIIPPGGYNILHTEHINHVHLEVVTAYVPSCPLPAPATPMDCACERAWAECRHVVGMVVALVKLCLGGTVCFRALDGPHLWGSRTLKVENSELLHLSPESLVATPCQWGNSLANLVASLCLLLPDR